MFGFMHKYNPF